MPKVPGFPPGLCRARLTGPPTMEFDQVGERIEIKCGACATVFVVSNGEPRGVYA